MSDERPFVGVDPGLGGAVAAIYPDTGDLVIHDMPVLPTRGGGRSLNGPALAHIIIDLQPRHLVLEEVGARPKQGVASMFKFGRAFGVVEGVCACTDCPTHMVRPQQWRKHHKLTGAEKDYSRAMASRLFPAFEQLFRRKKDVDRAEAALLALLGMEVHGFRYEYRRDQRAGGGLAIS